MTSSVGAVSASSIPSNNKKKKVVKRDSIFIEDADSDLQYNEYAKKIIDKIQSYFRKQDDDSHMGMEMHFVNGQYYVSIDLSVMGMPFDGVLLFGEGEAKNMTGAYNQYPQDEKLLEKYPYSIQLNFIGDMSSPLLARYIKYKILTDKNLSKVLYHELIHFLDSFRYKEVPASVNPKDKEKYNNSAKEYNAYFYNIAENMMEFIQEVKRNPKSYGQMLEKYYIDPNSFVNTLTNTLSVNDPVENEFMSYLRDKTQKKLLRRLYKLYSIISDMR